MHVFQNDAGYTLVFLFMNDWVLSTFSTDWKNNYCSRLAKNRLFNCLEITALNPSFPLSRTMSLTFGCLIPLFAFIVICSASGKDVYKGHLTRVSSSFLWMWRVPILDSRACLWLRRCSRSLVWSPPQTFVVNSYLFLVWPFKTWSNRPSSFLHQCVKLQLHSPNFLWLFLMLKCPITGNACLVVQQWKRSSI